MSTPAQAYIWLFRGTPLLVQLLIIYTGLPLAIGVRFSVLEAALLADNVSAGSAVGHDRPSGFGM